MWVEILDPKTCSPLYTNLKTGEYSRLKPSRLDLTHERIDWWELFDHRHQLHYYYNTKSGKTIWKRPEKQSIISLVLLQKLLRQRTKAITTFNRKAFYFSTTNTSSIEKSSTFFKGKQSNTREQSNMPSYQPPPSDIVERPSSFALEISKEFDSKLKVMTTESSYQQPQEKIGGFSPQQQQPNTPSTSSYQTAMSEAPQTPNRTTSIQTTNDTSSNANETLPPKTLPAQLKTDITQFKLEGFAKKYFSTHKKGIFRRKVPVEKMLDAIPLPLLNLNKNVQKEALKNFKTIQKIMGDRSNKSKTNSEDIQELLQSGINSGELRDEIYCQLIRQLTNNPRKESVFKGWELMACLVVTFPPSKNFESYLENFLQGFCSSSDEKIQTFAKYCVIKFERICKKGPRGKVPTVPEIDRAKEAAFFPSVFGEALPDIMDAQRDKYPNLKLPRIMTFLADAILKLNGCATEGIFRVPGDADAVTDLRLRIEKGNHDISGITDASVPASLFKFWLRDLTDPIVPAELYDYCIKNAESEAMALKILDKIPEHNRNVLLYLISFLQIIAEPKNQPVTRMSVNNIAMVFAPNILRCPSDNLQVILENTKYEQAFVRTLISGLKSDAVYTMK